MHCEVHGFFISTRKVNDRQQVNLAINGYKISTKTCFFENEDDIST